MNRLIQGDVGSGKTVVALLAILMAVSNGFQTALMAPTEILAEQQSDALRTLLRPLDLEVALLTSTIKGKSRPTTPRTHCRRSRVGARRHARLAL